MIISLCAVETTSSNCVKPENLINVRQNKHTLFGNQNAFKNALIVLCFWCTRESVLFMHCLVSDTFLWELSVRIAYKNLTKE